MEDTATNLTVANAPLPATYEAAKMALSKCSSLDECQDWADKAEAMASYARQAADETLRKMADRIQARAVRRLGELLKQYDGRGAHMKSTAGDTSPSQKEVADSAGISRHQTVTAVRVANIPQAVFEANVESENPLTVKKLAVMGTQSRPRDVNPDALSVLPTINKFAEFCSQNNPQYLASAVGPSLMQKMRQNVASIDAWLDQFVVYLRD